MYQQVLRTDGGKAVFQVLLPAAIRDQVLTEAHQNHGHQGVGRTLELLRQRCYWRGMASDVKHWCQCCSRCQVAKDCGPPGHSFMGHLLASEPNEILAIDFTMLEPTQSGLENVLVLSDVFSKYTLAVPTRDQRASTVARVLVTEWFSKFGAPARIHSDQGRNFESVLIQHLCNLYNIQPAPLHIILLVTVSASALIAPYMTCFARYQHTENGIGTLVSPRYCTRTTPRHINLLGHLRFSSCLVARQGSQ